MRYTSTKWKSLLRYDPHPLAVPVTNAFRNEGPSTLDLRATKLLQASGSSSMPKELLPRRWLREPGESCVDRVYRTQELVTDFVVQYKWEDPQWRPLLRLAAGSAVGIELRARHIAFSLKHLIQKDLPNFQVIKSAHSILHPRGVAERAFVRVTTGGKISQSAGRVDPDVLVCEIVHEGPLHAPGTSSGRTSAEAERGVVGMSTVWGWASEISRRSIWKRTRQIGSTTALMGTYDYTLMPQEVVHRQSPEEVFLLEKEYRNQSGGGTTVGIISSHSIARHPYHYVGNFDAPAQCALDAALQLQYRSAVDCELVRPGDDVHCLAWITKSQAPYYYPLEVDVPFTVETGRPEVYGVDSSTDIPSSAKVGAPWLRGAPIQRCKYSILQGNAEYFYDEGAASRAYNWWHQHLRVPYAGEFWTVRDCYLDDLKAAEYVPNPFSVAESKPADVSPRVSSRQQRLQKGLAKIRKRGSAPNPNPNSAASPSTPAEGSPTTTSHEKTE
jgi:hypothetical protein